MKVRRVTKDFCKLNTKRVRLNKVTQHEKKYLLHCSMKVYQRIIKLECRESRYLSMFSCNRSMYLKKQLCKTRYIKEAHEVSPRRQKSGSVTPQKYND